ncbi:oligosaccharide flippase family protein [Mucilaginibacter sabulilitoris]|uniref:Oligosaccharide flippase family protein n=1 Tax=Mucilaginibacter sabulilitoris TaxID=1173583 RepID=A0ABZ0TUP1_9SPHI|nr:oligosaccharide flippase family protein [Mucilaginibacter sabulilitoris]WPU95793.1 oligosaccharide flippase family protein [Mucilaginibacter sabulilitoris]
MIKSAINKLQSYLSQGHERTIQAKLNIIGTFFLKGLSILLSLLIVPMTINYISPYQYGIWITLSSIVGWLSFFDIGFGNGLRNKFVEAITKGEKELARIYVSTTYAILTIIIIIIYIITAVATCFIDWSKFLNAPSTMAPELTSVVLIVLTTFALQFILSLISTILNALQKPVMSSLYSTLSQVLVLIGILFLIKTTKGSLLYLSLIIGGANIFVLIVGSIWFYTHELKEYTPNWYFVKFRYAKDLMGLGIKFFFIQIIALVYYETNNIIITKVLNPINVTVYNISFKYMSVIGMFFTIIITPFWSAFSEAKILDDYGWMKSVVAKLRLVFYLLSAGTVLMVMVSPYAYKLWLGNSVTIPFLLTLLMGFWQIFNIWNSLHSTLIYGLGKIKLQLIGSLSVGIINLPITIFFCYKWQLNGVIIAQVLMSASISWVGALQLKKLLDKSAHGIWNR